MKVDPVAEVAVAVDGHVDLAVVVQSGGLSDPQYADVLPVVILAYGTVDQIEVEIHAHSSFGHQIARQGRAVLETLDDAPSVELSCNAPAKLKDHQRSDRVLGCRKQRKQVSSFVAHGVAFLLSQHDARFDVHGWQESVLLA